MFAPLITNFKQIPNSALLIFLFEMLTLGIVALNLRELGMRREWLLLYGWSPLILKEFSNSLHVDFLAIFFLTFMIYFLIKQKWLLTYLALALVVLTKVFAAILIPFLGYWTWKRNPKATILGGSLFLVAILLAYTPFLDSKNTLFDGLHFFLMAWRVNAGVFSVIQEGVLPFTSPAMADAAARGLCGVLWVSMGVYAFKQLTQASDVRLFGKMALLLIASLFFLAPTGNPWYFTWIFPFLFFLPSRALILFSGLVFFYYLDFYFTYHLMPNAFAWVKGIEYGIFYSFLGWELWNAKKPFRLSYRLPTNATPSRVA